MNKKLKKSLKLQKKELKLLKEKLIYLRESENEIYNYIGKKTLNNEKLEYLKEFKLILESIQDEINGLSTNINMLEWCIGNSKIKLKNK